MATTTILTPRVYGKNLKWNVLPKNKIDTVTMQTVNNTATVTTIDSRDITSGEVGNTNVTLPLADSSTAWTKGSVGWCTREGLINVLNMACHRVYISVLEGTYDIDLQSPIVGTPQATFELEGTTTYTQRGALTVDDIDNIDITNICTSIENNKYGDEPMTDNVSTDSMNRANLDGGKLIDYNQGWVPCFAWVRKSTGNVPNMTVGEYLTSMYRPTEATVLTTWNNNINMSDWLPPYDGWSMRNIANAIRQGPYRWVLGTNETQNCFIPLVPEKVNIVCTAEKINDYKVRVTYKIPVRYAYAAGAKAVGSFIHTTEIARDTYAYKDVISKITIAVTANTFDGNTTDLSYSRVNDTTLTTDAVNENVLTFDVNEFITPGTSFSSETWTTAMSKYILNRYKDGKYVVECEVPVWWAIQNGIDINSELKIKLQDGTYISRGGTSCVFQVKTIDKVFKNSAFYFSIRLLEE